MKTNIKFMTIRTVILLAIALGAFLYNFYWDNYYIDWDEEWLSGPLFVVLICPTVIVLTLISTIRTIMERDYTYRAGLYIAINAICSALAVVLELYYIFVCMW